ncbi:MAG: PEP-CTERM sorting domain-containing protein [Deltaproteobacteria bacterium]|nr:PEP-CTERM sorting domain-containing protein [Deltaproteobacteria bacterium]
MRERLIKILATGIFAFGLTSVASAETFNINDLNNLGGLVIPEADTNPGLYQEGTLIDGPSYTQYVWDLGSQVDQAIVFLSTDHLASDTFSFNAWGSNDLVNWSEAVLSGVYRTDDADDFASLWTFSSASQYLGVNSFDSMVLSESDAPLVNGGNEISVSTKAEFDGAVGVPEPSALILAGLGIVMAAGIGRSRFFHTDAV